MGALKLKSVGTFDVSMTTEVGTLQHKMGFAKTGFVGTVSYFLYENYKGYVVCRFVSHVLSIIHCSLVYNYSRILKDLKFRSNILPNY